MLYFDKKNYKILKAIYDNDGITSEELHSCFDDCEMFLISLARESYIGAQGENGHYLCFGAQPFSTSSKTKWFTLPRGNFVIEDKRWRILQWSIPVIISATAVVISLAAFFHSSDNYIQEIVAVRVDALYSHIS